MSVLLIPIYLDALYVPTGSMQSQQFQIVRAMANYHKLPYFNDQGVRNDGTPNLSETILSDPFEQGYSLPPGIHLHWALPDALTRGVQQENVTVFPAVPNRWLVTRKHEGKPHKIWIVESDHLALSPEDLSPLPPVLPPVTVPYPVDPQEGQPFRYLGRKREINSLEDYSNSPNTEQKNLILTAMGMLEGFEDNSSIISSGIVEKADYVKGTFAALYPNCHSVFGLHDETIEGFPVHQLEYEVVGWYSNQEQDALYQGIKKFQEDYSQKNNHDQPTVAQIIKAVEEQFEWVIPESTKSIPQQMLCYAKLIFNTDAVLNDSIDHLPPPAIAIGNTATEALSAYLAHQIDQDNKAILEEQLEALHFKDRLEQRKLDLGAKFQEARHEKGFTPVSGGIIWTVQAQNQAASAADESQVEVTLPESLAEQLNQLNQQQQIYQRSLEQLESMRQQVFADWYKFMLSTYWDNIDIANPFPDKEDIRLFLDDTHTPINIRPIEAKIIKIGKIVWRQEKSTGKWAAHAQEVVLSLMSVVEAIKFRQDLEQSKAIKQIQDSLDRGSIPMQLQRGLQHIQVAENFQVKVLSSGSRWQITNGDRHFTIALEDNSLNLHYLPNANQLSFKLAQAVNNLQKVIDQHNQKFKIPYHLKPVPAPRYWQANDPVVLMTGDAVQASDRYGQDGVLNCEVLEQDIEPSKFIDHILEIVHSDLLTHISHQLPRSEGAKGTAGIRIWNRQPWHPIILAWEVELYPHLRNDIHQRGWVEKHFLQRQLLVPYYANQNIEQAQQTENYLEQHRQEIEHWLNNDGQGLDSIEDVQVVLKDYHNESLTEHEQAKLHSVLDAYYEPSLIADYYSLPTDYTNTQNACDLTLKSSQNSFVTGANNYSGFSLLTPHAGIQLQNKIVAYLDQQLLPDYYQEQNITAQQQSDSYLSQNLSAIKNWYEDKNPNKLRATDPVYTALQAYAQLQTLSSLSQALGGFNNALCNHKRTMQLKVDDPLASVGEEATLAADVQAITEESLVLAPLYENDFNPIRNGEMEIVKLRLLDSFGRMKDVRNIEQDLTEPIVTTEQMNPPDENHPVFLPPRLAQPARVNFRWLAANRPQEQELNSHPATTPICGWILPNNLDRSLMIYDSQGAALGSINQESCWESAPGRNFPLSVDIIPNPHLRKMVIYLLDQGVQFVSDFISTIDNALENIDPENAAHHQGLALLMGRPIALVRAFLNLELQGLPAITQHANALKWDIDSWQSLANWPDAAALSAGRIEPRTTNAFTQVKFPIRLGEYKQFNDGLVGYWQEQADGSYQDKTFYACQSDTIPHQQIVTHAGNPIIIEQSVISEPQILSMLVDPRCLVHATSGILPTKAISIPPDQYTDALQAIEITFLSAPILSESNKLKLSVPKEPGYVWSWLSKTRGRWVEETELAQMETQATFNGTQKIREGWLKLSKEPNNSHDGQ